MTIAVVLLLAALILAILGLVNFRTNSSDDYAEVL